MPNYYYIDANGQKQGLVSEQQLQALASRGAITPTTPLETEGGHKGVAGQLPGLNFNVAPTPSAPSITVPTPPAANMFCTNCGNSVAEQAVACMNCGAKPVGHKKFCRYCGTALNAEQVICIKCGAAIGTTRSAARSAGGGGGSSWQKNKLVAGLLGILLGGIGAHKYYMGSWGWGIVFTAICLFTAGFAGIVTGIIGLIEGIMFLVMNEDAFAEKYPPETEQPFRW